MRDGPGIGAVVLAYGDEPLLVDCLEALQREGADRVIVVDNGPELHDVPEAEAIARIDPGRNLGFAEGCNLGAAQLVDTCDVLLFCNSDLLVAEDAPRILADALRADSNLGLVSGLIVELSDPGVINSAGNPVHYSMMSWAGGWGDPASSAPNVREVASASGALMAMRTPDWIALGGLSEMHFAYAEDVDLSLRVWQSGRSVACLSEAKGQHDYHYSNGGEKLYLLERNRLINVVTLFESTTIAALLPGLVVVELGVLYAAVRGGWLSAKVRGYRWLYRNRRQIRQRRAVVQGQRLAPDRSLVNLFTDRITPSPLTGRKVPRTVNAALAGWRSLVWPKRVGNPYLESLGVEEPNQLHARPDTGSTTGHSYTERLTRLEGARWKRILNVQAPYRARLRRLKLGRTLEVGCGIGRNLGIQQGMVGVDHNLDSVAVARARGHRAWTTQEWPQSPDARQHSFDSLLLAHVLEHMTPEDGLALLQEYLPFLRPGGRVIMICPQEKGFRSDATHVHYYDVDELAQVARRLGLRVESTSSFPFPRAFGRVFTHNEHSVVARNP